MVRVGAVRDVWDSPGKLHKQNVMPTALSLAGFRTRTITQTVISNAAAHQTVLMLVKSLNIVDIIICNMV